MSKQELIEVISEYDALVKEILAIEQELAELAEEINDLENHICRELRAQYDTKIGNLEYQATTYNLEINRLKHEIEELQAYINRQEEVDVEELARQVKEAFKKYEEDLKKKAEDMERDREYSKRRARQDEENERRAEEEQQEKERREKEQSRDGDEKDSEDEPKHESPKEELKRLYRKIVKKLHPDMNPDATEEELELFRQATKAYSEGDLITLREIAAKIEDKDITEQYSDTPDDIEKLRELRDKLIEKRIIFREHIIEIKSSFPYTEKEFLEDEVAVRLKQEELQEYNKQCADKIIELQKKIKELRKKASDKRSRKKRKSDGE